MHIYRHQSQKKWWTTLGPELRKDTKKTEVIVKALSGLKSAGVSFRSRFARCIEFMGYQSCKSDSDLWLKSELRSEDGIKFYSYILCYVDDMLCMQTPC